METAARYADVYLMWGEPVELMADRAAQAKEMAADLGRTLEVGTRFQIVCRETDAEARTAAEEVVGSIADSFREKMRSHATAPTPWAKPGRRAARDRLRRAGSVALGRARNGFARARMGTSVACVGSGESIRKDSIRSSTPASTRSSSRVPARHKAARVDVPDLRSIACGHDCRPRPRSARDPRRLGSPSWAT